MGPFTSIIFPSQTWENWNMISKMVEIYALLMGILDRYILVLISQ